MKRKLTDWYKPSQKPVRNGHYQCKCCSQYFYWDGKHWHDEYWREYVKINEGWRGIKRNVSA
jgi:hypothetical protein